jgi:hypothetical protein
MPQQGGVYAGLEKLLKLPQMAPSLMEKEWIQDYAF